MTASIQSIRLRLEKRGPDLLLVVETDHKPAVRLIQGEVDREGIASMRRLLDEAEGLLPAEPEPAARADLFEGARCG